MRGTANKFLLVWALVLTAFLLMGLVIPNTFTAGTTISSAQMNANFDAVRAAVDALEAQVATQIPGGWLVAGRSSMRGSRGWR